MGSGAELADRAEHRPGPALLALERLRELIELEQVGGQAAYLHDGRARSLLEAILWHDGEGAASRDRVKALPKDDRDALIAFLESL